MNFTNTSLVPMVLSTHTGSPMHIQAHGMIPYSSATSLKCCTNSAVEGHVLMFLGTGLSLPDQQISLDPKCEDPNPPIGISFLWCILYICILHYMIVKDNILNKEHLGEYSWFNNQDALLDGYLEFLVPCLEARNTSLPGLPLNDLSALHHFQTLPSTKLIITFDQSGDVIHSWTKYQAGKKKRKITRRTL